MNHKDGVRYHGFNKCLATLGFNDILYFSRGYLEQVHTKTTFMLDIGKDTLRDANVEHVSSFGEGVGGY